jgi:hypothetical protein
VIKKEAEKILKYKYFSTEIQGMWNMKAKTVLVIMGANGTISVSLGRTSNNGGEWNHFCITWTVPEQHTGKAEN